jgi:stress-induced-phosphoprotein 1
MEKATEYKNLGNEAFKNKKFDEAIDYFTKAIEQNGNDHVFYSNRSGAYASLEKYEEAFNDAAKCVQLKPDWGKGY